MKKIFSIVSLIFLSITILSAQVIKEKAIKVKQERKLADLMYAQSHYYTAIEYYKEVVREKPEERYAVYWLGMSYLMARDYENAVTWLGKFHTMAPSKKKQKRIEKENKSIYGLSRFYYGLALKQNGDPAASIKQFEAFKGKYSGSDEEESSLWRAKAKNEIDGANLAIELKEKSPKVRVSEMGDLINTAYEEAAPVIINDSTLYYTSLNEDDLIFVKNRKDIPPYNLYQSKNVDGEWQKGKKLPSVFQDEKFGTGNAAISEDGNRMYFCKCWNNEIDEIICNLYFSKKSSGGSWSEPEKLNNEINSNKYTSTQPAVRSTGDEMDIVYFVSDREGGTGGMDIWYFFRTKNGGYKGPRLVKGKINTKGDEMTPFFDNSTETLYFSSNGHPSIGGFDIFFSQDTEDLSWAQPQNVGYPLNSPADDLYYRRAFDNTDGFLVSNREGTEKINNRYTGDDIYAFSDFKYGLEGYALLEEKTGESQLEDATVSLYEIDSLGEEVLLETLENVSDKYFFDLKADKDYKIEVNKNGFAPSSEFVTTKNLIYEDTLQKDLYVDKTIVISTGKILDETSQEPIEEVLVSVIEILPNGERVNHNTIKVNKDNPNYILPLKVDKRYELAFNADDYFKNTIPISTYNLPIETDTIKKDIFLTKIEKNKSYELENILYDFGKATLRPESKEILDNLYNIMNDNPGIEIELGAHTDAIGSDAANMSLSQKRAQSCVDYLIEKGIAKYRMTAKGYGESTPIAPNTNEDGSDNPEGRQKNRRTEFKVVEM